MSRMEPETTTCKSRDILSIPWIAFLVFWLPAISMVLTAESWFGGGARTAVWTSALGIMGTACTVNALRCGRVHCYITGPFFLAMALITLLYSLGILELGRNGWSLIGATILIGSIALCCLPELFLGKYRRSRRDQS